MNSPRGICSVYGRSAACAFLLPLAACATGRPRYATDLRAPARAGPSARLASASELLGEGRAAQARARLVVILRANPDDSEAKLFLAQIDRDPRALLGQFSHPYRAQPGDTLGGLAQRFLGDQRLFYALARYNGIAVPDRPLAGRMLKVPGQSAASIAAPRSARLRRAHAPALATATPAPPAAAAPQARDLALARQLRGAALEDMSRGRVESAIGLLERAQGLDPANPLIAQDLGRARRLQTALQARR